MKFFSRKAIKFSCTYSPILFCKILKEFFELIQSYQDVLFSVTKWPICPEQIFFGTNHYYYFHLPDGPFYCAKFTTNSYGWSKVVRMLHFCAQNGPFAQKNSFWKLLISFSSNYQPLSLCKISKKSLQWIHIYRDVQFLGMQ